MSGEIFFYSSWETLNVLLVFIKRSPAAFVLPILFNSKSFWQIQTRFIQSSFVLVQTLCKINALIALRTSESYDNQISSGSKGITLVAVVYNNSWKSSLVVLIFISNWVFSQPDLYLGNWLLMFFLAELLTAVLQGHLKFIMLSWHFWFSMKLFPFSS